jgi:tetratricopeptide (TPR) repeat protein
MVFARLAIMDARGLDDDIVCGEGSMVSMRRWIRSTSAGCFVTIATLTIVPPALAQDHALEGARDLYAAAAYDDALVVLNDLHADNRRPDNDRIEYYRALCLLALGRAREAEAAIEAAVTAAPFAQPSESDAAPHIRSAFRDVRRRLLPAIIDHEYADAKTAFARRDPTAAERFRQVLTLIDEADGERLADQPSLSQTRALAGDYLELSVHRTPL